MTQPEATADTATPRDQELLFPLPAVVATVLVFASFAIAPWFLPEPEHPVSGVENPREIAIVSAERLLELELGAQHLAERPNEAGEANTAADRPGQGAARAGGSILLGAAEDLEAWSAARAEQDEPRSIDFDPGRVALELRVRASALLHLAGPSGSDAPEGEALTWQTALEDAPDDPWVVAAREAFGEQEVRWETRPPPELPLDGLAPAHLLESWYTRAGELTEADEVRAWIDSRMESDGQSVMRAFALLAPAAIIALVGLLIQLARGREAWVVGTFEPGRDGLRTANAPRPVRRLRSGVPGDPRHARW